MAVFIVSSTPEKLYLFVSGLKKDKE